jgi:hypothetical protein
LEERNLTLIVGSLLCKLKREEKTVRRRQQKKGKGENKVVGRPEVTVIIATEVL